MKANKLWQGCRALSAAIARQNALVAPMLAMLHSTAVRLGSVRLRNARQGCAGTKILKLVAAKMWTAELVAARMRTRTRTAQLVAVWKRTRTRTVKLVGAGTRTRTRTAQLAAAWTGTGRINSVWLATVRSVATRLVAAKLPRLSLSARVVAVQLVTARTRSGPSPLAQLVGARVVGAMMVVPVAQRLVAVMLEMPTQMP